MVAQGRWLTLITSMALVLGMLLGTCGCGERGVEKARREGYRRGYEDGTKEGVALGARDAIIRYETEGGLRGLVLGIIIGAGLLALLTHDFIASQYRKRRRRRQIGSLLRACAVDLDGDIFERVFEIGLRKRKLEDGLKKDKSVLISQLYANVSFRLRQMDDGIVRLAILMQQLRTAKDEVVIDEKVAEKKIQEHRQRIEASNSAKEQDEIREAIAVETLCLQTAARNEENIRRCDLKLSTLSSFLDNLIMTVANLRTVEEQDSFERFEKEVGKEVKDLEAFFERTLEQLFTMPKV